VKSLQNVVNIFFILASLIVSLLVTINVIDVTNYQITIGLFMFFITFIISTQYINEQMQLGEIVRVQKEIQSDILKRTPIKFVYGEEEIVNEINRLQQADLHVELRVAIFGHPKSPLALTTNLVKLFNNRANLRMTSVLVLNRTELTSATLNSYNTRIQDSYKDVKNRNNQIHFYVKEATPPIGIDAFILDRRHIMFNLSEPSRNIWKAILMENVDIEIVNVVDGWFQGNVINGAIPFEDYYKSFHQV
jgi:hypothetical protein